MRTLLSFVPGLGHARHGRTGRGLVLALVWLALLSVAVFGRARVVQAFSTPTPEEIRAGSVWSGPDAKAAVVFLYAGLVLIPVFCAWDCRRLGRGDPRQRAGESQWKAVYRRFGRNPVARTGLGLVLVLYAVALLAPLLAPHDPNAQVDIVETRYLAPGSVHVTDAGSRSFLLGTDKFGRDVLSRIIYGSRISLTIGFVAVGIAVTLGTLLGALAGYFGGKTDWLIMRFVDVLMAFPRIFLVLTLIAIYRPSIWLIVAVIGATAWMGVARIVRGQILSLKEQEFMQAARALGMPHARVILRHVLPNTISPVIVAASLMIGDVILTEATLSFLGLGVQPPTASWGNLINQGRDNLLGAWWIATFPGLAIVATVVSYNLLGDGLR
ncbi:MAG: ABC transporter permease, partial [Gemmatimonadetes bacterium]|nr:ABC transporter permease [Gemmatimonadota bacterium]